jgi:hypothetical protein
MKSLKYIIVLLAILLSDMSYSQKIVRMVKSHVLIDMNKTSGLKIGNKVNVFRKLESGQMINNGKLKIILFKEGKTVGKIISQNPKYKIAVGDIISIQKRTKSASSHTLSYLSIGTGLIAFGLGYYYYDQADQMYADYVAASTLQERDRLYNKTSTYDNNSNFSYGIGGGLIAFGIIYYFINRSNEPPPTPPTTEKSLSISPIYKYNYVGMGVNICLNRKR